VATAPILFLRERGAEAPILPSGIGPVESRFIRSGLGAGFAAGRTKASVATRTVFGSLQVPGHALPFISTIIVGRAGACVREWLSGELRQFRSSVAAREDCPRVNLDFQSYISGMDLLTMRVEFSVADLAQ